MESDALTDYGSDPVAAGEQWFHQHGVQKVGAVLACVLFVQPLED